jgi:hypothetical protein
MPDEKWLSMDDHLKFVNLHLKYILTGRLINNGKRC